MHPLPAELNDLVAQWTCMQLDQASRAHFLDSDLPFTLPPPALLPALFSTEDPLRPAVHSAPFKLAAVGLHFVGGLDVGFRENGEGDEGIACLAVLSWPELELIHSISHEIKLSAPYIPSFLSFREADEFKSLVDECARRHLTMPQVLFVDGNGRLHPRQAGSAVAVGLATGLPTLGVAKEYHPPDHSQTDDSVTAPPPPSPPLPYPTNFRASQKGMRTACRHLLPSRGNWFGLVDSSGDPLEYIGAALRASPDPGSTNAVFVSSGHRLSLETCVRLTLASCTTARVPEPIRQADLIGRREARARWGEKDA